MEIKELEITVKEFEKLLEYKQQTSRPLKGFRKNKAPALLMSYLYGNNIMEQAVQQKVYGEVLKQIQDGYNIKDCKIKDIKLNTENKDQQSWKVVIELEKEKLVDKEKENQLEGEKTEESKQEASDNKKDLKEKKNTTKKTQTKKASEEKKESEVQQSEKKATKKTTVKKSSTSKKPEKK